MTVARSRLAARATCALLVFASFGCQKTSAQSDTIVVSARTLALGAYTTPQEVYGEKILPAFAAHWKQKTGQTVTFEQSYLGSGAQARAIAQGYEADIAALSLDPDIQTLADAKLVTHDWHANADSGIVTRSVVVFAVRSGNPKGIHDWADLTRAGIAVLTPNPKTSGGAMWNIAAAYGASLRGHAGAKANDSSAAEEYVRRLLKNVKIMDKGARESMLTFESGVGDVAITYENEVIVARKAGKAMDYVVPTSTILIENPIATVDTYASKHGNTDIANEFVAFVMTPESQAQFTAYGLRPVKDAKGGDGFPAVSDLFTIRDLGGWPTVRKSLFGDGGMFDRASGEQTARR